MPIMKETLDFLVQNKMQDNKEWFLENKHQYQEYVFMPLVALVEQLGPVMREIDPLLITAPKVDKTISRIYRDTRFSKDKSLYRDIMWCVFGRDRKVYAQGPAFVFEFSPKGFRYGCGYYQTPPAVMEAIRKLILKKDPLFLKVQRELEEQKLFTMEGDFYKRPHYPNASEQDRFWLERRSIAFIHESRDFQLLFSGTLGNTLAEGFIQLKGIYEFLCKAAYS